MKKLIVIITALLLCIAGNVETASAQQLTKQQEKAEKNWSLIVPGVLLIFFGALCAFYPGITLLSVTFVAGAGFVFAGIVNIISYVRERKTAGLSGWYVAYGILDIIIGLMLVIHPLATAYVIPWLIGAFIMAYSIVEIFAIIASRKQLGSIWGLGLVSAILSLLVGICFFIFPESLAIFIAVFAVIRGATLIASGWSGYQPV